MSDSSAQKLSPERERVSACTLRTGRSVLVIQQLFHLLKGRRVVKTTCLVPACRSRSGFAGVGAVDKAGRRPYTLRFIEGSQRADVAFDGLSFDDRDALTKGGADHDKAACEMYGNLLRIIAFSGPTEAGEALKAITVKGLQRMQS